MKTFHLASPCFGRFFFSGVSKNKNYCVHTAALAPRGFDFGLRRQFVLSTGVQYRYGPAFNTHVLNTACSINKSLWTRGRCNRLPGIQLTSASRHSHFIASLRVTGSKPFRSPLAGEVNILACPDMGYQKQTPLSVGQLGEVPKHNRA
ncbi:hypothetical protein NDU88_003685 [Pleurodeles waltl]|uniref:Uncharacterized protein n=1 Tax=Pleurodeles waltl TaxID=8319 RepID=A0AAV7UD55_PLEWA|nr:hypothetical protein NDU88_003685 [Pleurodeles waltl]